ncbi:MAG: hypothetical protein JWN34_2865 [Bryobacterales bacterium]|nr:hypothetical protein [Bryobacterales bacterium]
MGKVLARIAAAAVFVLVANAQITLNPTPSRSVGQTSNTISSTNPNLVEGRELLNPQGIALDVTTNPPGLYIADTGNNRVLGFRSALGFANGKKADIVLGQVDFATTFAQGPNRGNGTRTTGTSSPTGLAVDSRGSLYIVDAGNNRILRFPAPFRQTGDQLPDLVLGQPTFTSNSPNQGSLGAATFATSVTTSGTTTTALSGLVFDPTGNLWATDPLNNRILRYNLKDIGVDAAPGPAADLVLGQTDFTTNTYAPRGNPLTSLAAIVAPSSLTFDPTGRLFVLESIGTQRGRVLIWNSPAFSGQQASRLLGVVTDSTPPAVSDLQMAGGPSGIFMAGDQLGIADTLNNRLLFYPPVSQWTSDQLNQPAIAVAGQKDFFSGSANQSGVAAADTLSRPATAAFSGNELFVADALNHRVVVLPRSGNTFAPAIRVLGQDGLDLNGPNLIEGREFNFSSGGDAGLAVDLTANPPRLYVADTYNNRILGFKDLRNIPFGAKADIVIGQPDFQRLTVNYPSNDSARPNQSGLFSPTGLYVDPDGNLFVADSGNGRVLRFPKPFDNYAPGVLPRADLVLGQLGYFSKITDASARTMASPYGIAQASEHGLLVSDAGNNRVLFFPGTSKTFTSGQSATIVFGQKDFNSAATGSGSNQMNAPRHIATDSDDHLYVADAANGRVLIFDHAPSARNDSAAAVTLTNGLSSPRGMFVSAVTGDIWVADAGANITYRFPNFNGLVGNNFTYNAAIPSVSPRAVAQDGYGNVFIADSANRVAIHVPGMTALNAGNYLYPNRVAPGMITALFSRGNLHQFGESTASSTALPLARTLNGLQVQFEGAPVPLFFVGTDQINFQMPMKAPQTGTGTLQVIELASGRILGETTVAMATAVPGIFSQAADGIGAAVAANEDGTLNTEKNPIVAGKVIVLYGTGQGFIEGAPEDGTVSNKALQSSRPPTIIVGTQFVTGADVLYAGLSPALVGVWQINVRVPKNQITLPDNATQVVAIQDSAISGGGGLGRKLIIYVKQP